ncbi:unnamed protein product [Periconia digitata]|uniref:Glyoxalase-like domain-containing protein n=1 Tax=Periconia digitata TaxID=1303443 RepID=A0A9W4U923_9PLEO|nr:unnamed protein product [Periconia digitata]
MLKTATEGSKTAAATTPTRLRQIALVTDDLEKARRQLTYVIGTEIIYEDPEVAQWGLKNILVPLGGDIIEVVSPFKSDTTAGRLLQKRGEGGYMIIMQTYDAAHRRDMIRSRNLAKVIWEYNHGDGLAVQYHPKAAKGGTMVEIDSHSVTAQNPTPLQTRFSPWHACGTDYKRYSSFMKRYSHLSLQGCVLRVSPGDLAQEDALRQWGEVFGVARSGDALAFTNARLRFIAGEEGENEGLVSVTVGVRDKGKLRDILDRAREEGVCRDGVVNICGVKWLFVLTDPEEETSRL